MTDLDFHDDPASFLASSEEWLARDPVLSTVVSSVTQRLLEADQRGETSGDHPRWWAVLRDRGEVVGVAMRTAPFAPYWLSVLPMPEAAAHELARALVARDEEVTAVNGADVASRQVAHELARLTGGGRVVVHEHMRLWEAPSIHQPSAPGGRLRRAREDDVDLAVAWWNAFGADAAEQAGRAAEGDVVERIEGDEMTRRIGEGLVWLWEDEVGRAVHLTAHNPPAYGVARVGPVYTPREARGHGYASAAVALVSQQLLDAGVRVCLFTDQANPTSNKIYETLGFRPVVDMVNLLIVAEVTRRGPA